MKYALFNSFIFNLLNSLASMRITIYYDDYKKYII